MFVLWCHDFRFQNFKISRFKDLKFSIQHSSFLIPHSSFLTPHLAFHIPHSSFSISLKLKPKTLFLLKLLILFFIKSILRSPTA